MHIPSFGKENLKQNIELTEFDFGLKTELDNQRNKLPIGIKEHFMTLQTRSEPIRYCY